MRKALLTAAITLSVLAANQGEALAVTKYLRETPAVSTAPGETHASLVTSTSATKPTAIHVEYQNQQQLRTGSAPNAWEVGWTLFNYTDNNHFYYVALKPNGWELGKEWVSGGVQQQQFLATGATPTAAIGTWLILDITMSYTGTTQATITVKAKIGSAAQVTLTTFTDNGLSVSGAAYQSGKLGLYNEDCKVDYGWARVKIGSTTVLDDDFSSYANGTWAEGSVHGPWTTVFNGGGSVVVTT
jgi:hypothetical protein